MTKPYSIVGSVLLAIPFVAIELVRNSVTVLPPTSELWVLLVAAVVIGIPSGLWIPVARVGFLNNFWLVPRGTFLLSRWLVCLHGTTMVGGTSAMLVLSVFADSRYIFFCLVSRICGWILVREGVRVDDITRFRSFQIP